MKPCDLFSGAVIPFSTPPATGADWDALDAVHLLHSDPHTPGRSGGAIASPPVFSATVTGDVNVQNSGEIRLAATQSAAVRVLGALTLAGGGLSGQGRVEVEGSTFVVGSDMPGDGGVDEDGASFLKNGVALDMYGGGAWSGGGLQARDGVSVVNRGQLSLSADDGTWFGHGKAQQFRPLSKRCLSFWFGRSRWSDDMPRTWDARLGMDVRCLSGALVPHCLRVCILHALLPRCWQAVTTCA